MRAVLITGSRSWTALDPIHEVLRGADLLLVGDCPTGADLIALNEALANDVMVVVYAASKERAAQISREHPNVAVILASDWEAQRRLTGRTTGAGPIRNQALAERSALERDSGIPVDCHAYPMPSSVGTWDCARKLEKHGFLVSVHRPAP